MFWLNLRKIDKSKDGHCITITWKASDQSGRQQRSIRLDAEIGVVRKKRLDKKGSILAPCASCEVGIEILRPQAATTFIFEGSSVPTKTLGTNATQAQARLDEQITLRRPARLKLQQLAGW